MATISRDKRFERAQMRVLFNVPFFAPGVARLPIVWDPDIPTASTDGNVIRWNAKWFDSLPDEVLPTVICHEVGHCLFGHLWRAPVGVDWDAWNQAGDHEVNLMLKAWSAEVKAKGLADPFPFPKPEEDYLADPKFADMAIERIYNLLSNRPKSGGNPGGNPGGNSGGSGNQSGKPPSGGNPGNQPAKGNQPQPQAQPQANPHSMPSFGQMSKPDKSAPQAAKVQTSWEHTAGQCAHIARGRGNIPGGFSKYVTELFSPKLPWWELVRNWLIEKASDDWNWMKPNTYFDESGFILPSLDNERIGSIVFARDTSGSVECYPEICAKFISEEQGCLDNLKPKKLVDICCDSFIHRVDEYNPGDTIKKDFPGGGGTAFSPVFEYVETLPETPKCLVYFTDLDGSFPKIAPQYPVLWVVYGSTGKAPFGETIHAD